MAFASRQARGRRQRKQSSAANSSSSRGLTIRCRTMTAIHRSGRCDKRDKESRRGCRMEPFRSLPLREHRRGQGSRRKPLRGEGESPMSHNVARHSYCSTALLHLSHGIAASQWICRAPARDAGKASSYQQAFGGSGLRTTLMITLIEDV